MGYPGWCLHATGSQSSWTISAGIVGWSTCLCLLPVSDTGRSFQPVIPASGTVSVSYGLFVKAHIEPVQFKEENGKVI